MSEPVLAEVRWTALFEANLAGIEAFWLDSGEPAGYDRLLNALLDTVTVNLARHPRLGRSLLLTQAESVEAQLLLEKLGTQLDTFGRPADMCEYVMADYRVLYGVLVSSVGQPLMVYLVSITHQSQLSLI
jgi:hypothetical protein